MNSMSKPFSDLHAPDSYVDVLPHKERRKRSKSSSVHLHKETQPSSPVDSANYRNIDEHAPVIRLSEEDDQDDDDDDEERENWGGRLDFILSCVGFAVGLGNIWRFPYLCYSSGGGAFLLPYLTFMVVCALPLFFLETGYGQFASLSPITIWRICPLFKGIGYGMVIITGIVCVYYNIIITWTFYYLFASMQATLPWKTCDNWWNTLTCVESDAGKNDSDSEGGGKHASEEFWERNVLQRSAGLEDFGTVRWPLLGCLMLSWFIVFLCLCKGVKSSGKVVYITATFPYLVLSILLAKCIQLPGAVGGVWWYLVPQWDKLASFKVWGDAATQIFFSVGMAWGSLITLSSYNKFNNNVYRDAMIVPCINCFTSVFAGLVIFSVLGFMSHSTGVPIDKVVTQGPGLIFIVYPEAVVKMPISHFWAILFFLMIFTLGLDSQFGMFETMTSAFVDEYPKLLRKKKVAFTAVMCLLEFCLGIPMIYEGGFYLLTLSDWYSSSFSLMLLSLIECVVISWIYGVDRFIKDIELMTGHKPFIYWKIMWKYITPLIVLYTWAYSLHQLGRVKLGDYEYPDWSIALGWTSALCSIIPLPIYSVYAISQEPSGTLKQRILKLIQPAVNFGPSKLEDKQRYFRSFSDFDWLRYNAVRNGMDWRTYQRCVSNGNKSESNMAAPLNSSSVMSSEIKILLEEIPRQQKAVLGDISVAGEQGCRKHSTQNTEIQGQDENGPGRPKPSYWNVDETSNSRKHARCYSI